MSETAASNSDPALPEPPKRPKRPKAPNEPSPPQEPKAANVPDAPTPPAPPRPPAPEPPPSHPRLSDPEQMRALAHPARLAVWDFLGTRRLQGMDGATATECAEAAGMTPSAMSYHLRTLAKAGFIEEAPSRGDARERVWRIGLHSFSIGADDDDPESVKLAEAATGQALADRTDEHFARWIAVKYQAPQDVRNAALFTQSRLRITVEEAADIKRAIREILEPYEQRTLELLESGEPVEESGTALWDFAARLFPHV